jgi:hypothetical protein
MSFIVTTYKADGTKERRPQGYGGGLCHQATAPYEKREVDTRKSPTDEADQDPVVRVEERQRERQG